MSRAPRMSQQQRDDMLALILTNQVAIMDALDRLGYVPGVAFGQEMHATLRKCARISDQV